MSRLIKKSVTKVYNTSAECADANRQAVQLRAAIQAYPLLKDLLTPDLRAARRKIKRPTEVQRTHVIVDTLTGSEYEGYSKEADVFRILQRAVNSSKAPKDQRNHVGNEIEGIFQGNQYNGEDLKKALVDAGLDPFCTLKDDGSIQGDFVEIEHECDSDDDDCQCTSVRESTFELVICVPEEDRVRVVRGVCSVLAACRVYVNKTCGLHVHLDMRNRVPATAYRQLFAALLTLQSMVPESRRANTYTKINTAHTLREHSRDRYHAINKASLRKYNTLEIRLHTGTTNAEKINQWIDLLLGALSMPIKRSTRGMSTYEFLGAIHAPASLQAYVYSRIALFSGQNTGIGPAVEVGEVDPIAA